MKRSTGLRNYMLAAGSLKAALDGKVIKIYGGAVPASADDAIGSATLLATVTESNDGSTGLTLAAAATGGLITKNTSEVWEGDILVSGTATFFRMETLADAGASSTTAVRAQGTIGLADADMLFSDTALVSGNVRRITSFVVSIPAG